MFLACGSMLAQHLAVQTQAIDNRSLLRASLWVAVLAPLLLSMYYSLTECLSWGFESMVLGCPSNQAFWTETGLWRSSTWVEQTALDNTQQCAALQLYWWQVSDCTPVWLYQYITIIDLQGTPSDIYQLICLSGYYRIKMHAQIVWMYSCVCACTHISTHKHTHTHTERHLYACSADTSHRSDQRVGVCILRPSAPMFHGDIKSVSYPHPYKHVLLSYASTTGIMGKL